MKDRDEIIKAAHQYASNGQIHDAIAEYLKILPYSVDGNIRNVIGDLYLKNESTDEAIKYFREAAVIFNKEESHAKAIALYHKILSINPDQHDVVMELAELNAERGFITQAIEGMSRAAEAHYSKGLPMKALGVYKKALTLCPSNIELKIKIADLHLEANHTDRAVKLYLAIAMEYEANAESVKAEHMYKKVFSLDPDNIESLSHLSRLAEDDQDLELAFEYMSKAAAIAPENREIMFEYSNLAAKAHKDISEYVQQDTDGPVNQTSENIQIPDNVNNCDATNIAHEPLEVPLENSNSEYRPSGEARSNSPTPLPITSTGSGCEEKGYTVPPDTVETGLEKIRIWDNRLDEDKNNPSFNDSIQGNTSNVLTGHETAEAAYDQDIEKNNLNMSVKKNLQNKSERDSRRLKRRVKTGWVHVLIKVCFTCVTVISFFITYNLIKNTQTVNVETQEQIGSPEPYNQSEGDDIDVLNNEHTITDLNTDEEQSTKKPVSLNNENYPQEANQDEVILPDKESETPGIDSEIIPDNSIEIAPVEEGNTFSINTEDNIVSTMKPDREIVQEKENTNIDTGTLSVSETVNEMNLIKEDNKLVAIEKEVIESTIKTDSDAIHVTEEPQVIIKEKLMIPVKESDTPGIDSEVIPDNSIDIALEEEEKNFSINTEDTIVSTMKPDREAIHVAEEPQVTNKGKLTVPVRESDTPGIDRDILPKNSIEKALEEEEKNDSNNTEDNIVSTIKPDREIVPAIESTAVDTGTLDVSETTDDMQQQRDNKEEETAFISFSETFDNNDNNWDIVETSAAYVRLNDGKYYIQNRRMYGAYIVLNGPSISTDLDFEVESHLNSVDRSDDHAYGLIFGAKNKEDFFVFQILPDNTYSIKKYFRGVALELAGGHYNNKPESEDFFNILKIACKNNKLSFFINGNFIDEVPDIYFSNRRTGLFADSKAEIAVDKILLHQQPR